MLLETQARKRQASLREAGVRIFFPYYKCCIICLQVENLSSFRDHLGNKVGLLHVEISSGF